MSGLGIMILTKIINERNVMRNLNRSKEKRSGVIVYLFGMIMIGGIRMQSNFEINWNSTKKVSKQVRDINYICNQDVFLSQREIVKRIIQSHPEGITDQEMEVITGFPLSAINGRRNELEAIVVSLCIYTDDLGNNHMRSMWGFSND